MKISEQIENYITNSLNSKERILFENQLKVDKDLQLTVESYSDALSALKREWVGESLKLLKWKLMLKKIGVGILVFVVLTVALFGFLDGKKKVSNNKVHVDSNISSQANRRFDSSSNTAFVTMPNSGSISIQTDATKRYDVPIKLQDSSVGKYEVTQSDSYFDLSKTDSVVWQYFVIDNTKDTSLVLLGGTKLNIIANTLVTNDNRVGLKDVTFEIREFSNYYDLWCHNLHTCSNKQQLISGGSLYIKATSKKHEVKVKEGSNFEIQFPSKYDQDMTIFYGNRNDSGEFNWTKPELLQSLASPAKTKRTRQKKSNTILKNDTIWYLESEVMDEGKIHEKYTFNTLKNTACFDSTFKTLCQSEKLNVKRLFIKKQNLTLRFHLNPDGKFDRYDYNFILDKRSTKYIKKNAQMVVDNERVNLKDASFSERIVNVTLIPKFRIETTAIDVSDSVLNNINDEATKKYVLNTLVSSNFGYINCDKFTGWKDKIDMTIKFDLDGLSDVKVFFKDYNSVMIGSMYQSNYKLNDIIRNQRILIIGISKDGKTMSINDSITADKVKCLDQQPYNLLKIQETLESFDDDIEL